MLMKMELDWVKMERNGSPVQCRGRSTVLANREDHSCCTLRLISGDGEYGAEDHSVHGWHPFWPRHPGRFALPTRNNPLSPSTASQMSSTHPTLVRCPYPAILVKSPSSPRVGSIKAFQERNALLRRNMGFRNMLTFSTFPTLHFFRGAKNKSKH
jgi:hypothetical protein